MVDLEQIDQWRRQLRHEPAGFARDLSHVLLTELERLRAGVLAGERRFASSQAGVLRAQLATSTECPACGDAALRHAEERMRLFGTVRSSLATVASAATGRRAPRFT